MRVLVLILSFLLIPVAGAISDLSVYSKGSYESQLNAPILVEWFHGDGDENQVELLEKMDRDGEITLLHWRTGADEEGGGLPDDDASARMMYHSMESTPAVAIDGYKENLSDIRPEVRKNEVLIDWNIQLIGSSEVELLDITATWTNPHALNGATQVHVFIIESNAVDSRGREIGNLVRDWAPSSSFNFANNSTNNWNETITKDHLDGAGISLGDATHADEYEVLLVMIGGFENETSNRVLSIQRAKMPTYWQSVDNGSILVPAILLGMAIVCIGFIVMAEKKRESGLPRLEGTWSSEANVLDYKITTGNSIDIGDMTIEKGWRSSSRIKKQTISAKSVKEGKLKVTGSGKLSLKLAVKVDQLGDWILDLNLPDPESNNSKLEPD